jgi:hypothetical protein
MEANADTIVLNHLDEDRNTYELNVSAVDMSLLYQQTARLLGLPEEQWESFSDCMEGRPIT